MSIGGTVFNPLVPNNQLIASAGSWRLVTTTLPTSNFTTSAPVVWNSQSMGIEQLVAVEILAPPGGNPVVASWDRPFFYINNLNSYPSAYGPMGGQQATRGLFGRLRIIEP